MVDFVELSNKRTYTVRTIQELFVEFVPQAFKRYFPKFSAERQPVICGDTKDKLYLPVPQYL